MSPPKGKRDKRVSRSPTVLPTAAAGTAASLAKVAGMEPPITARLNGEVWALSLEAAAIGITPAIDAIVVIRIDRRHPRPLGRRAALRANS